MKTYRRRKQEAEKKIERHKKHHIMIEYTKSQTHKHRHTNQTHNTFTDEKEIHTNRYTNLKRKKNLKQKSILLSC